MGSRKLVVSGAVQNVGFRDWAVRIAREWNLTGWVRYVNDGRVEILAQGDDNAIDAFADDCRTGPPRARVSDVQIETVPPVSAKGFTRRLTG